MSQTSRIAPLWTVQDVADYLRVPVQTLYSWRAPGVRATSAQDGQAPALPAGRRDGVARSTRRWGRVMPRPPLSLGTYGKIKTWREGKIWLARVKFRDFDGIVRFVKRSGKTKAAAERELKTALADRQMPVKQSEITAQTTMDKIAELWLAEIMHAVDAGSRVRAPWIHTGRFTGDTSNRRWVRCGCGKWTPRSLIGCWRRSRRRPSAEPGQPRL